METEVGLGQIIEVRPKFAFIKMSTGTLTADGAYIVRKTSKKVPAEAGAKKSAMGACRARAFPAWCGWMG